MGEKWEDMDEDNYNLIEKAKAAHVSGGVGSGKQFIHCFPSAAIPFKTGSQHLSGCLGKHAQWRWTTPCPPLCSQLSAEYDIAVYGMSFGQFVCCPGFVPSQLLMHPSQLTGKAEEERESLDAKQSPKHWCDTSSYLAKNTKCGTIQAVKEINFIPALCQGHSGFEIHGSGKAFTWACFCC